MSIIRRHWLLVVAFVAALALVAVAVWWINQRPTISVRLGETTFAAWVADDDAERIKGLSGVTSLSDTQAMLFDFQRQERWGIWMKDMKLPIDIIWLDRDKTVVYIVEQAPAELGTQKTYKPPVPARYVLEVRAGAVADYGVRLGDSAQFNLRGATR